MIQKRPYEYMTKYTPQTEWIRGSGIFICMAFFTIELGGGTYIFSSLVGSLLGMIAGFLLAAFGTLFFLFHLGRPIAAIRACLRPRSSWISRGVLFISFFLILTFISIVLAFIPRLSNPLGALLQSNPLPIDALLIITCIISFLMMIYAGFAMSFINGIPLWNTTLLPILYVVVAFWGGAEIASGLAATNGSEANIAQKVAYFLLLAVVLIIPSYLISIRYGSPAGGLSVKEIVRGRGWLLFWIVVVAIGMVLPVCASLATLSFGFRLPLVLLWVAIICGLAGDFAMRFLLFRNAYYAPLTPISDVPTSPV
jgi:formate-dependent nitrite reductase membrane component NrfD